jgi:serine/threonine protein kinase
MEKDIINGYELEGPLSNDHGGFSKWGFAVKDGKEYFIKQLISPVFPSGGGGMTEAQYNAKRSQCFKFEDRKLDIYRRLNDASKGNLVKVREFFVFENHYYVVTDKIASDGIAPEDAAKMPMEDRLTMCRVLAFDYRALHSVGLVHADIKPDNVILKKTMSGKLTAKVIDFDNCFFISDPPPAGEEFNCDLVYMAPEVFKYIRGEDIRLSEKIDIFALGLLFHNYLTGRLPGYTVSEFNYPFEAILKGGTPVFDDCIESNYRQLLEKMLAPEPENRPSAEDVFSMLYSARNTAPPPPPPRPIPPGPEGYFAPAGDL